jgi:Fic family protein
MLEKRTYLQTHPWITFDLGLEKFQPRTWMLLGEAASKALHIAGVPLAPEIARQFHCVFLAKGALATAAIEGNTLTLDQVEAQVAGKLKLPPSQRYLQQEVQNIIDTCNWLVADLARSGPKTITLEFCCDLNSRVLKDLELEEGVKGGKIRHHSVVVGNVYRGAPPEDCAYLVETMCDYLQRNDAPEGMQHHYAILKALFAHIYMALIHPFGDGNGRTARILEYYILLQNGFAQPTGHLLSNHYNKTRAKYYLELDKISKSGGDTSSFAKYALEGFVYGLVEHISIIRKEHFSVAWENYVHQKFRGKKSQTDSRRRELVLHLSGDMPGHKISDLTNLSSRLTKEYALKTDKTLSRDINAIVGMGLATRVPGRRIRAKTEVISAFLPWHSEHC